MKVDDVVIIKKLGKEGVITYDFSDGTERYKVKYLRCKDNSWVDVFYKEDLEIKLSEDNEMILRIGEDGKLDIHNPEDYIEMTKEDADLMVGFINQNKESFDEYCKLNKK